MQKTGFKHKYPTIEFNSENPKKRVLMNVSVYVKRHEYPTLMEMMETVWPVAISQVKASWFAV